MNLLTSIFKLVRQTPIIQSLLLWPNDPSLQYLFAGPFQIDRTSPMVDEHLHEIYLALIQDF